MSISRIPKPELIKLANSNRVQDFAIEFEPFGMRSILKMLFERGVVATFRINATQTIQIAEFMKKGADKWKWPPAHQPPGAIKVEFSDWSRTLKREEGGNSSGAHLVLIKDAAILAIAFEDNLIQCVRMTPANAVWMSDRIFEARTAQSLRDIRTEPPPTPSRH